MKLFLSIKPDEAARAIATALIDIIAKGKHEIVELAEDSDVIVSVGGDGTLLYTIHRYLHLGKPFLGVNGGRVGYHCAVSKDSLESFDSIVEKTPTELGVFEVLTPMGPELAIQDLRVERINHRALRLVIHDGEELVSSEHVADGIIVTGSMGSTGYHASAGGQPIAIGDDSVYLTPICPITHSIYDSLQGPRLAGGEIRISPNKLARLVLDDRASELDAREEIIVRYMPAMYKLITRGAK